MDILQLLGRSFTCPRCRRRHAVGVEKIISGPAALDETGAAAAALLPEGGRCLLVADQRTYEAAGARVARQLGGPAVLVLRPRGEKTVSAREEYLAEIAAAAAGSALLVTVGAGTVSDLGKYHGHRAGLPVLCVATAPSMNGYTSGVAALIIGGVKVTLPVNPARAVIADTGVLAAAPAEMRRSGYADIMAKPCAGADWRLSALVTGEPWCPLALEITGDPRVQWPGRGAALAAGEPGAIAALTDALNRGGLGMLVAGTSAPASGGEHLLSHFLDMHCHQAGREVFALHGLQVGVGVVFSALLHEAAAVLDAGAVARRLAATRPDYAAAAAALRTLFPAAAPALEEEFRAKRAALEALRAALPARWPEIRRTVLSGHYRAVEIRRLLGAAGCPLTLAGLGVSDRRLAWRALTLARFIRRRLTILDLAAETGLLEPVAEAWLEAGTGPAAAA